MNWNAWAYVVSLPYAPETRPIWPRLVAGFAALVALIITTSVLTAAPSVQTQASSAGSSFQGAPTDATVVPPGTNPGSGHTASQHPTASQGGASPQASAAPSASPQADAGSDAGAPSAVTALPTSATAIRLDWAPVSGAASYDIERSIDTVDWSAVASTGGEQTQYTDVALSSGTTYYYRVVAFVEGEDASRSDVVSATTTVDTSTAPVFISATGSATSIELEWGDVYGEIGYRIDRSLDGTSWVDWDRDDRRRPDLLHGYRLGLCDHVLLSRRRRDIGRRVTPINSAVRDHGCRWAVDVGRERRTVRGPEGFRPLASEQARRVSVLTRGPGDT